MNPRSRREYLEAIRKRYKSATSQQKSQMLDEFCSVCCYHRKYAIRLLSQPRQPPQPQQSPQRSGRKPRYHTPEIKAVLQRLSVGSNMIC
jgi:hypothetical protein